MITIHFYDHTATKLIRTRSYKTRAAALRAIARAAKKGQCTAQA